MSQKYSRREMLSRTGRAVLIGSLGVPFYIAARGKSAARWPYGAVVGENTGMKVGDKILAEGGNAIDAAVAAALAACIAAPARSGIGGYGGHMIIALAGGKKITAIDFNTAAPAAARPNMFPLDEKGAVKGRNNFYGWKAAGVPGILAGLQLALNRYGTRSFREVVQPSIQIAENGFVIGKVFANSVDSFYRGDIAQRIAEAFQKNGGLVTTKDLAAYKAREAEPLRLQFKNFSILTAPLTAGGLTTLQALSILKALEWDPSAPVGPAAHARLDALRFAWKDRLELLGDPETVNVPVKKLLSIDYAHELAAKVRRAVNEKKPAAIRIEEYHDEGTINLSAVDRHGNLVAVTVTHGNPFGAQVTVDGLGLTLGHGLSRFDPNPGHPNAPGPGKRPVINVSPSIVLRKGGLLMAVGGGGGVRIPNSIFDFITQYIYGASMDSAIAAPRMHCTGTLTVAAEPHLPKETFQYLKKIGFKIQTWESSAIVSAVSFDPANGECRGAIRGPAALGLELSKSPPIP
jgi:gamma-glutamyltranspeptidase/glutathione hydrolase